MLDVFDPKKDVAALQPLVDRAIAEAMRDLAEKVAPALGIAIQNSLDGLTIEATVKISKKQA